MDIFIEAGHYRLPHCGIYGKIDNYLAGNTPAGINLYNPNALFKPVYWCMYAFL